MCGVLKNKKGERYMDEGMNINGAFPGDGQPETKESDAMQDTSFQSGAEEQQSAPGTAQNGPVCRICGAVNVPGAKFCNICGAALAGVKICPACGTQNLANAKFCNSCGAKLQEAEAFAGGAPAPAVPEEQNLPPETENTYESKYTGGALTRLFINIGVVLLSAITLGIAYPFLMCSKEKWLKSHTFVNGRQLEFDGNGAQLIGKFIVWLLLSLITFGLYAIFRLPLNMQRWKTKHTHVKGYTVDGKKGESKFTGSIFGLWGVRILNGIMMVLGFVTFGFASTWGKLVKLRWFNEKKIIDGVRIHNDAKVGQFWVKRLVWNILMIVTVFIHTIFVRKNSQMKFLASHDKFANPSVFPRPESIAKNAAAVRAVGAAGANGLPYTASTENTNKALIFIVLTFVIPIPLLWPILANVFASKAKKEGEPNGKNAAIAARVILALQLIGYITMGVVYGVIFGGLLNNSDPYNGYNDNGGFDYYDAQQLEIGMTQGQVRSYVGLCDSSSSGFSGSTWTYYSGDDTLRVTFDSNHEVSLIEFLDGGSKVGASIDSYGTYTNNATESGDDMLTLEYNLSYSDGSWTKGVEEATYDDISIDTSYLSSASSSWRFIVEWELTVDNTVIRSSSFSGSISRISTMYNSNLAERVLYLYDRNYARDELAGRNDTVLEKYDELLATYGIDSYWR